MGGNAILGEEFPSKLAVVFRDQEAAEAASARLRDAGFQPAQVRMVRPHEVEAELKLEPERRGIFRTLARTHVRLGIAGLLVGVVLAAAGVYGGLRIASASPMFTFLVCGFFGAIAGLLIAGLLTLRPDHDRVIMTARDAASEGQWTVVVHAADAGERERAQELLEGREVDFTRTL